MKNDVVIITDYIDDPEIEREVIKDNADIILLKQTEIKQLNLYRNSVLLVWHKVVNRSFIDQFKNCRGIIRYGVGVDNLDLEDLSKKKIPVCNTPDYGIGEVSNSALAMILCITRGTLIYDFNSRNFEGGWQENILSHLRRSSEMQIGIIGCGRIGSLLALKLQAVGFGVSFYDPYKEAGYEKIVRAKRFYDLASLLESSDVVSIHTPLTNETRELIDEKFISAMKRGASLVNTARGKIVKDFNVLYEALRSNHLHSVGLDVLPEEPPKDNPLINAWKNRELWLNGRLFINPHTAYYSKQAYVEMRQKAALNALRILKGEKLLNEIRS